MDMNFDVNKIFQERLASSMGLDKYIFIINQLKRTDVSKDLLFQRTFNGFYIVRRNDAWRKVYYDYFENIKGESPTFSSIITHLYAHTGNIEPSFSSKMLATIFPEKPIWDQYVIKNLNYNELFKSVCRKTLVLFTYSNKLLQLLSVPDFHTDL